MTSCRSDTNNAMNIEHKLDNMKQAVERELERILAREDTLLFQAMRHSVLCGGKRFRPLLVLSAAESFAAETALVLPFACGLELIHNYSLIHDDLPAMDDDDFRRGRPSCHKKFGEDIALLAGDGLLTLAFEVMAEADVPRRLLAKKVQVIKEIARLAGVDGMIGGQLLDITFTANEAAEKNVLELMHKKTGAMITASVRTGAVLGEASPSKLKAVTEYGINIGLAFQLRDDILDAAEKSKKAAMEKPNYASLFGLEKAEERLEFFVKAGTAALDKAAVKSASLSCLAEQLLK